MPIPIPFPRAKTRSVLTHYTGQAGLEGILSTGELWATDIRFLNDSAEFRFAVELGGKVVEERLSSATDPRTQLILQDIQMFIRSFTPIGESFVFSLSAVGDDLGQWRAYSDQDLGYGIVLDGRVLRKALINSRMTLVRCEYNESEQRKLIAQALDAVIAHAPPLVTGEAGKPERLATGFNFSAILSAMSPALKHPAFAAEREWRLISIPGAEAAHAAGVRAGKYGFVPYIRVALGKQFARAIRRVTVGPMPDQAREEVALRKLLALYGLTHVKTSVSAVPYRTW